jgi:hypothetical protein
MNDSSEDEPATKLPPKLRKASTLLSQSSFNFNKDVKLMDVDKLYSLDTKPIDFKVA